jgi:hypothetical protein
VIESRPPGRTFGYTLIPEWAPSKRDAHGQPVRIGTRLGVDPQQAPVVARIFEAFAQGKSPRAIAETLNADGVSPPGAAWNRSAMAGRSPVRLASAIYGNPKLGTGILRNPIYRGVLCWNRSRWVRDPETKRRTYQLRDQSERIEMSAPELRIVSDELWQRAQRSLRLRLRHARQGGSFGLR